MKVFQFQFPVDMVVLVFQPKLAANPDILSPRTMLLQRKKSEGYKFNLYLNCNSEDVFEKI